MSIPRTFPKSRSKRLRIVCDPEPFCMSHEILVRDGIRRITDFSHRFS